MRSTRRSSSATRRTCGAARDRRRRRGARVQLRGEAARRAHRDERAAGAGALPRGRRGAAADARLLGGEQGRLRDLPRHHAARRGPLDRRGVPRGRRPAQDRRAAGGDRRGAAGAGGPRGRAADHGGDRAHEVPRQGRERGRQARRPAARAAATASARSCSRCRSSGSGASARSPSAKLHALGVRTVADAEALGEAGLVSVVGRAAGRHLNALASGLDPRPVDTTRRRRSIGSQQALGRRARSDHGARRDPGGHARSARPPPARGPPHGAHRGAAAALRRLLARHPLALVGRGHRAHRHPAGGGQGAAPRRAADDPRARHHAARRLAVGPRRTTAAPSSPSRSTCGAGPPSTARSMPCSSDSAADRSRGPPSCACDPPWKSPDWTISHDKIGVRTAR